MKFVLVYGMTDNPGGIETYLHNLFSRVHGKMVMLDFVSDFPGISGADQLLQKGARLYHIPPKGKNLCKHWTALWKILRQHKEYETVYFNVLDAGSVFTMLIPFVLGRKIVVHSHNGKTEKVRLHQLCRPLLNLLAAGRVACSEVAADHMFGSRAQDVLVIPNTIDVKKFLFQDSIRHKKRAELGIDDNTTVVCHVGRISEQKNPFGLVDIFEAAHRVCADTVLLSVGSGELMEQFQQYIEGKGLLDAIICLGVRQDIPEILQAADVFLLPSLYEGLPIALLEAQAAGLPCVISDEITQEAVVTDTVCALALTAPSAVWAETVLHLSRKQRENTWQKFISAGLDVSCCEEYDRKLISLF